MIYINSKARNEEEKRELFSKLMKRIIDDETKTIWYYSESGVSFDILLSFKKKSTNFSKVISEFN